MLPEILKTVSDTSGLLKEIYGDLAKPGVRQVGKSLKTVLGLGNTLLIPLCLANAKAKIILEKNLNEYRKQVSSIPEDSVTEVAPEVGVPILEKLTYTTNEEISNLYVNLLAKASSTKTQDQAHPSFVHIIENLSPDEAVLIKYLQGKDSFPFIDRTIKNGQGEYQIIEPCITGLELQIKTIYPKNIPAYLSNLEGLGVINFRRDIHILIDEMYATLDKSYKFEPKTGIKEGYKSDYNKGVIEITTFGKLFIKCCTLSLQKA